MEEQEIKWRAEKMQVFTSTALTAVKRGYVGDAYYFSKWACHEAFLLHPELKEQNESK